MTDRNKSVYASAPFKFIVDGETLYIHADLVSLHSKPLDRMMNGSLKEAQERCATLKDVDEGTFVRFIEWAHKGYYTPAEFVTVLEDSDTARSCADEDQGSNSARPPNPADYNPAVRPAECPVEFFGSRPKKGRKSLSAREDLVQSFISRRPVDRQSAIAVPPPRRNQSPAEVYIDVFLSHARLYVFAEEYDIQTLKTLVLDELHAALANFTLHLSPTGDIIELLRYVYANTAQPKEGVEDMRTLMTQYMGCEMEILMEDPDFGDLIIEDGGDLLRDFMKMVGKRIDSKLD